MGRRARLFAAVALLLAGCASQGAAPTAPAPKTALPAVAMVRFPPTRVQPPQRSNAEMARDFLDLAFSLESGRELPVLSRYEGPVTIRMTGSVPPTAPADLTRLVGRLRSEAGIDIRETGGGPASITVEFLPRHQMQALVPRAACFVAPRVSSWSEYRRLRGSAVNDWATLSVREQAAVFIPNDTPPQEIRDCLHEEIAQALGPVNDLFRLPDSVFNDDNLHDILTGFDMLMLRAYYAPELHSGMSRDAVAMVLPGVLARLNPGGTYGGGFRPETPPGYVRAIETALGPGTSEGGRIAAAERAIAIAEATGGNDLRTGFAWLARGRLLLPRDPVAARDSFLRASAIYHARPETALQAAHADMHLALFALSEGRYDAALALADSALPPAMADENAALTATFLMVRAEALERHGQTVEAGKVRLDSIAWARYGFGPDTDIRVRLADIAALASRSDRRTQ